MKYNVDQIKYCNKETSNNGSNCIKTTIGLTSLIMVMRQSVSHNWRRVPYRSPIYLSLSGHASIVPLPHTASPRVLSVIVTGPCRNVRANLGAKVPEKCSSPIPTRVHGDYHGTLLLMTGKVLPLSQWCWIKKIFLVGITLFLV